MHCLMDYTCELNHNTCDGTDCDDYVCCDSEVN